MNPEMAAAAGDGGFGPKCEGGNDKLWTATTDNERRHCDGGDGDFFPSFFSFLAVSPDLKIWCMEIVSEGLLFIEFFFSVIGRL